MRLEAESMPEVRKKNHIIDTKINLSKSQQKSTFAVHFIGGHVHKTADFVNFGAFQQHVGAENVVLGELERVAKRVVHVGLRRKVHDGVDFLAVQHVVHEVRRANVPFHELVVGEVLEAVEVFQASHVVQLVKVDNVAIRVLLGQQNDSVAASVFISSKNKKKRVQNEP